MKNERKKDLQRTLRRLKRIRLWLILLAVGLAVSSVFLYTQAYPELLPFQSVPSGAHPVSTKQDATATGAPAESLSPILLPAQPTPTETGPSQETSDPGTNLTEGNATAEVETQSEENTNSGTDPTEGNAAAEVETQSEENTNSGTDPTEGNAATEVETQSEENTDLGMDATGGEDALSDAELTQEKPDADLNRTSADQEFAQAEEVLSANEGREETGAPASTETTSAAGTADDVSAPASSSTLFFRVLFWAAIFLLSLDGLGIVLVSVLVSRVCHAAADDGAGQSSAAGTQAPAAAASDVRVGTLHQIGARPYQEDSYGVLQLHDGLLAIVADGMGGLSGGDRVSQKIVQTMAQNGAALRPEEMDRALEFLLQAANYEVNQMLGPDGIYKSGSTLLSVLVSQGRFQWISVGDSRIYFFHRGVLTQLNQEHTVGQELMRKAMRGLITYEEAKSAPNKNRVTSFVGMGELKYVDKSRSSIPLEPGDRILLMSDGVFNTVAPDVIQAILARISDPQEAADQICRQVMQAANPRQDNFTAVILGI